MEDQNWHNKDITEETAVSITEDEKAIVLEESAMVDDIYVLPVEKTKITSPYGYRHLSGMKRQFHSGIDFQGNQKYAFAVTQSIVTKIKSYDKEYPHKWKYLGNNKFQYINVPLNRAWSPYTIIESVKGDYRFVYTHGVEVVKVGQLVQSGEPVIRLGNYGNSRLQHLHFEVHEKKGEKWITIDPEKFLKERGLL
jgi:murein DD-endopeptidase MepM/ murein hydrolase activator NlpD